MSTGPKVLYVSPVGERGGAETLLLQILKYQSRQRYQPMVAFLRDGPLVQEVQLLGAPTVVFPTTRFRDLITTTRTILSIRSFLRHERVALAFGNMAMGHLYGGLAALGTETRAVWFQHSTPQRSLGVDLVATQVPAKAVFVYTEGARRSQAKLNPRRRIAVIPGCTDVARFDPRRVNRGALRRELKIDADCPIVACVARLQRWKGHSLFLRTGALVHRAISRAHFVIVGGALFGLEQDYEQELRREAAQLLPRDHVHFLGHRHDLPEILADIDLLVHCPITPEPFGLVLLEAMAMQVPVVATRAGGPAEIVLDGRTGILVPLGDPELLAGAVIATLSDPTKRRLFGMAARQRVEERFSAQRLVSDLEEEFDKALAPVGRRGGATGASSSR
jgi:glycosyltransferase involved in cell wall biosynthesis